jgi:nucleoside-diphosphate-sugar epimerase
LLLFFKWFFFAALICLVASSGSASLAGFIASHVVHMLLEQGYKVRGTVRNSKDAKKVKHLLDMPNASQNLQLFDANLVEAGSFDKPCEGMLLLVVMVVMVVVASDNDLRRL